MSTLNEQVAEEIRVMLARRNISASELARRTGITQRSMSRRITGEKAIDMMDLERIAAVLEVKVADLLPREREEGRGLPSSPLGERVVATVGEQRRKTSTPLLPAPRPHRPGRAVRQTRPLGRVPEMTVR